MDEQRIVELFDHFGHSLYSDAQLYNALTSSLTKVLKSYGHAVVIITQLHGRVFYGYVNDCVRFIWVHGSFCKYMFVSILGSCTWQKL